MEAYEARKRIWSSVHGYKKFHYADIITATNNFSTVLGNGDAATVYKGHLNGHLVAVKVRKPHSNQGEKAFMAEIVALSMYGDHRDIIRFHGCFLDEHNTIRGLVYEFMANGSLEDHLVGHRRALRWGELLPILIGVGNGLVHLHSHGVVHRDIMPQNILLDGNLFGKITDFGLCKMPPQHGLRYLDDPVYPQLRDWTTQQDVHDFGVVLLEVLYWKQARDHNQKLHRWVIRLIQQGEQSLPEINELIKRTCMISDPNSHISRLSVGHLAFQCVRNEPSSRPAMTAVVNALHHALQQLQHHHQI